MGQVNLLGFGCVSLTQHTLLKRAQELLAVAFDSGITHFDTAPLYGNGFSEKILGSFIKNKRSKLTVTTKFGLGNLNQPSVSLNIALLLNSIKNMLRKQKQRSNLQPSLASNYRIIDARYVEHSLNTSLKNLQTDYLDYYFLHEAMPRFLTGDALCFLKEQKQKGIIRELGIASGSANLLDVVEKDIEGFGVLQYENGPSYKTDENLIKFSNKKHFYHSTLKSIPFLNNNHSESEWAGILLNRATKINPAGKILFSTTKIKRLQENLAAFDKYSGNSLHELNNIINAIY